ncbi:MAG: (deoxy)nucleoside triphosphate pyrophosphohydrolase [Clostridia bacterium]|nr:(deoxy)nucleoside triphosphate pyrophosphohydrolase [Clostridia bacterium]
MVQVAAALIWDGDRFMICQRPRTKTRALEWEFVGGKAEPGETLKETLVRECREELGVTVAPGEIFMELDHVYPDITIHLTLFHAVIAAGTVQMLEHNDIRWITPAEIDGYEFCPADAEILEKIKREYNRE